MFCFGVPSMFVSPAPVRFALTQRDDSRRGGITVLMAFVLPMLALLAAFCINLAQMQLVKTELAIATDAAARAGGRAFSEEQTVEAAKTAARLTAAMNEVAGEPYQLDTDDSANEFEFGVSAQTDGNTGRFYFTKVPTSDVAANLVAVSSVRINGKRTDDSLLGPVPFIFPNTFSIGDFSPVASATAMQVDRDISLVLDRSGSMDWKTYDWPDDADPWGEDSLVSAEDAGIVDLEWRYRNGRPQYIRRVSYNRGYDEYDLYDHAWEEVFGLGPAPNTPWEDLVLAVDAFLRVLDQTPQNEQVSIASYNSHGTLDCWLLDDFDSVRAAVAQLGPNGSTGIGNGMNSGKTAFTHENARPYASKTMVVMTDGNHNYGTQPNTVAQQMMSSSNLNIQTVTFGGGADQETMQEVAVTGLGRHYHADSGDELVSAFEEIANNLPTILTN
ncbi:vWA domain-containing protein [Rhodopirellula europaea]|uniref:von Willebrand factor type A n=1 Tax=Rhodopirellula europaea SH398 TaxID=1263868 RepID=M5RXL8_9BACT|nr:vWA domain-containing protein [Rhodopirellula europaea]EMI23936.1 von Willebrand factor type A [Rhodopirellula europaea SH398]